MGESSGLNGPYRDALPQLPIFAGLADRDRDRIVAMARRRVVPAGSSITLSADGAPCVYVVRRGYLKTIQDNEDGDEVTLAIHGPGDLLGNIGVAAQDHHLRAENALAIVESELIVLRRDALLATLPAMPALSLNLLALYADRLQRAGDRIESLATADVEQRLIRLLHDLARAHGEPAPGGRRLPYRITQVELASMVGASRVRVNQMLGELKRSGIVVVADGRMIVRHPHCPAG
ncbi:MAG: Crp/Fnr family transcriptional regulator [Chloroflexota bacterium]